MSHLFHRWAGDLSRASQATFSYFLAFTPCTKSPHQTNYTPIKLLGSTRHGRTDRECRGERRGGEQAERAEAGQSPVQGIARDRRGICVMFWFVFFFPFSLNTTSTRTPWPWPWSRRRSCPLWTWEALPIRTSKSTCCRIRRKSSKPKSTGKPSIRYLTNRSHSRWVQLFSGTFFGVFVVLSSISLFLRSVFLWVSPFSDHLLPYKTLITVFRATGKGSKSAMAFDPFPFWCTLFSFHTRSFIFRAFSMIFHAFRLYKTFTNYSFRQVHFYRAALSDILTEKKESLTVLNYPPSNL